jgi:RNA polymerase sigma factor (TIGR02999 family)
VSGKAPLERRHHRGHYSITKLGHDEFWAEDELMFYSEAMQDPPESGDVTRLLALHADGDAEALDRVVALVYPELLAIARRQLRGQKVRGTLDTVALVHEAYLRPVEPGEVRWTNRAQYFGIVALAMRRVIVDCARRHSAKKRGGGRRELTLDPERIAVEEQAELILELHNVLDKLSTFNERLTRVVECRFFAGLTLPETAEALAVSRSTVQRDWLRARAWLQKEMAGASLAEPQPWTDG